MKLYQISIRNLLRNKLRSIFAGAAIAIVTMGIVLFFGFADGMLNDYKNNIFDFLTGHIRIRHKEYSGNEHLNPLHLGIAGYRKALMEIEGTENIAAAGPRIKFGTMMYGSPRIGALDISDPLLLARLLRDEKNRLAARVREKLKPETRALVDGADKTIAPADFITLLDDLNHVIQRYELHDDEILKGIALSPDTDAFLKNGIPYRDRFDFNRLLLEDAFPDVVKRNTRTGKTFTGIGFGVDIERERSFFRLEKNLVSGRLPEPGKPLAELAFTSGLAKKMNLTVGDKITITTKTKYAGLNGMTFRITGIITFGVGSLNSALFFLPLETAQNFLKMSDDDSVLEILCKVKDISRLSGTINTLSAASGKSGNDLLSVMSWKTVGNYASLFSYTDVAIAFMALIFLFAGTTVIMVTTIMVIFERMKEIGTMAAMGMTGSEIVRLFFLESFFLSIIAAFIGVILGLGITIPMSIYGLDFSSTMKDINMEVSGMIYPSVSLVKALFIFIYAVAVASFSTFIPSQRAAKIEPVAALRSV